MRESAKVDMNVRSAHLQLAIFHLKSKIKRLNDMGETGVEVRVSK